MANKKFSEFVLKTNTSGVSHIVGYSGAENVQITPTDFITTTGGPYLPTAGGTMTGALVVDSTATVNDILTAGLGLAVTGGTVGSGKLVLASTNKVHLSGGSAGLVLQNTSGTKSLTIDDTLSTFVGLVSGITPVDAANFVTKAYVDGGGGAGSGFLPLSAGPSFPLTGDLTINKATPILTLNSSDVNVKQGIVFSNGGTFDASIKHGASSADMEIKVGRNATWGGAVNFNVDNYDSYFLSRNLHKWSILGNEKMRLDSTGNLGVGVSPAYKLQVAGSVALDVMPGNETQGIVRIGRYDANTTRYNDIKSFVSAVASSNYLKLAVHGGVENANVNVMTLLGNGNVGVGTNSPKANLHISDPSVVVYLEDSDSTSSYNITSISNSGNNLTLDTRNSSGGFVSTDYQIVKNTSGAETHRWFTQGSEKMRLDSAGNVKINTTLSSQGKLTVKSNAGAATFYNNIQCMPSERTTGGLFLGSNVEDDAIITTGSYYFNAGTHTATGGASSTILLSGGNTIFKNNTGLTSGNTFTPTERIRISSIGTLDVQAQNNNVNGMSAIIARLGSNSDNTTSYAFIAETGGSNKCFIHGNGNIVNANNSYGSLSDKRLKENIKDVTPKLDDLMKVKVRNFNMIGNESKQIGVVAQELEEVFPSMIQETKGLNPNDETLYKGVKYSVFVPILIKAIQELKAEIELLKK